jgi:hypothetical protein
MDGRGFDKLTRDLATGRTRRSVLRGLIGGGAAVLAAKAGTALADPEDNVLICHFTASETNPYELISVAPEAAEARIAHGDLHAKCKSEEFCKCPIKCPELCERDNQCCDGFICIILKEGGTGICEPQKCINPETCNNDNQCCPGHVCTGKGICGHEECFNPKTCKNDHDCCPGSTCIEESEFGQKVCTFVK